jgi:hypothetical protein
MTHEHEPAVSSARTTPGTPPETSANIFWRLPSIGGMSSKSSELPQPIGTKSMQQDYSRAPALFVVGEAAEMLRKSKFSWLQITG